MTAAPDPKILADAIALAEEGLKIFRPHIADPDIKREVEFSEAFVAAAKAYGPMREALSEFLAWFDRQNDDMEGIHYLNGDSDKYAGNGHDDLKKVGSIARAALNPAGPA